jgi:gamma-glutamyl hercynylcysteine S-oxide synthase
MAAPTAALKTDSCRKDSHLLERLAEARTRTDGIFALLTPNAYYDRPIRERHRLIFYLGHLEAFDWNLLASPLGLVSKQAELDKLFAFGIDPVDGGLPTDEPKDWPTIAVVEKYRRNVRDRIDEALRVQDLSTAKDAYLADGTLLNVAIEHRLMHAETLAYLLHNVQVDRKVAQAAPEEDRRTAPVNRSVTIPSGIATLGQKRAAGGFGWDNEFDTQQVLVPEFKIDVFPVTNADYLRFMEDGGYETQRFWRPEDWAWIQQEGVKHPHFWSAAASEKSNADSPADSDDHEKRWNYRMMFGSVTLPPSWPVYVSHAEASAYAKWAGKKLPTEEQWQRAAYGTPEGRERMYPWGDEEPEPSFGNFHHQRWDPSGVHDHPEGASAFGIFDLLGNGWEWTSTPFAPLPGFEPYPFYKGYSADFFDGKHYVMKGGSARTDSCMLRRSYRNWFQSHYPYVYGSFRCVEE